MTQSRLMAVSILLLASTALAGCNRPPEKKTQAPSTQVAQCAPATPSATPVAIMDALKTKAAAQGSVRVIVRLAVPSGVLSAMTPQMNRATMAMFKKAGVKSVDVISERLPYVVAEMTPATLDTLASDPSIAAWSEDQIAFPTLAQTTRLIGATDIQSAGSRGAGQGVAILDTGVDASHPFLAGRVVSEACFSTTSAASGSVSLCPNGQAQQIGAGAARPCADEGCEHGTHVAGIAAGRATDFSGVAPDADVIAVQVFSRFAGAACGGPATCVASFTSDQIRALDFVLQQARTRSVAAVNMSLGGGRSVNACDNDLEKPIIDQLRAAGVATVIAAGNDGQLGSVSFPGCISTAITVGATTKADRLAPYSNCGPVTDVLAPGDDVNSSAPGSAFIRLSGTSMAAPHVAGAFAALRSTHPTATVDQIEAALERTGTGVSGRPRIALVQASAALDGGGTAMAANTDGPVTRGGVAALAELPEDKPVRVIVKAKDPQSLARAEAAARAAGAKNVTQMGSQPMLSLEVTPKQARALAQSESVETIQVDRVAKPN